MRREADFFDQREPHLLFIAKRLKEALRAEALLTGAGIDYGVETDRYIGGFVFRTERVGAFFYVPEESLDAARSLLKTSGLKVHEE
ncbi:MAG: hypothetical protein WD696_20625 [Bryobacteraceae bacterium]